MRPQTETIDGPRMGGTPSGARLGAGGRAAGSRWSTLLAEGGGFSRTGPQGSPPGQGERSPTRAQRTSCGVKERVAQWSGGWGLRRAGPASPRAPANGLCTPAQGRQRSWRPEGRGGGRARPAVRLQASCPVVIVAPERLSAPAPQGSGRLSCAPDLLLAAPRSPTPRGRRPRPVAPSDRAGSAGRAGSRARAFSG